MGTTLGKLHVRIMAAGLMMTIAPSWAWTPQGGTPQPSWEGRWVQTTDQGGHALDIGALEIAKCDQGLCVRRVEGDQCASPVVLDLKDASWSRAKLVLGERTFDVRFTLKDDSKTAPVITAVASEGGSFVSRRAMLLRAELAREGDARCPAQPTS